MGEPNSTNRRALILSDISNLCLENQVMNQNKLKVGELIAKENAGRNNIQAPSYKKISIIEENVDSPHFENVDKSTKALIKAMCIRKHYMDVSLQNFNQTTNRYLIIEKRCSEINDQKTTSPMVNKSINYNKEMSRFWPSSDDQREELIFQNGIMTVIDDNNENIIKCPITFKDFAKDYTGFLSVVSDGPLKTFCFNRLTFLKCQFDMHRLPNGHLELNEVKLTTNKDFYNINKVDTHIHASSSMTQKHLQQFMKNRLKNDADKEVLIDKATGKKLTLKEVFNSIDIGVDNLTVDKLDVHCDYYSFHRFDTFNSKYDPAGHPVLREVFLKTDNHIQGKYFAELIKEVIFELEKSKYVSAELRLSVYGRNLNEWNKLAKWAVNNDVNSKHVKWLIQLPRIYSGFRSVNLINNFQEIITNVFIPLFEVTRDPLSNPELHTFLQSVSGFDSVDDESKQDGIEFHKTNPLPENWASKHNPPYAYYLFYMYANMTVLNHYRQKKGLNTFNFRPHCGEAGSKNNLVAAFLLADNISHGVLLRKSPVMQYLYYLCQVGVAMSPISNNYLFLEYNRNPFYDYFCRGLNVSLSTDDPLQFHYTREPLMEEYGTATHIWKLMSTDKCELARNSVMMSGFSDEEKASWLGKDFKEEGVNGNDISLTNVPNIRISYRYETLINELESLLKIIHC